MDIDNAGTAGHMAITYDEARHPSNQHRYFMFTRAQGARSGNQLGEIMTTGGNGSTDTAIAFLAVLKKGRPPESSEIGGRIGMPFSS